MSKSTWPWPDYSGLFSPSAGVESLYYDTSLLSLEDRRQLAREKTLQGEYVWLAPGRRLKVFESLQDCAERVRGNQILVSVAGVGSSLTGAAAFAKSLMQAADMPVVAVVSHYGVVNLQAEVTRSMLDSQGVDEPAPETLPADLKALQLLLMHPEVRASYLVGHSRGARLIADLTEMLDTKERQRLPEIVTFGCVVGLPDDTPARQYLGSLDWVGRVSSEADVQHIELPGCGHHMNPMIPGRMDPALILG